jgi:hypothetical protein
VTGAHPCRRQVLSRKQGLIYFNSLELILTIVFDYQLIRKVCLFSNNGFGAGLTPVCLQICLQILK